MKIKSISPLIITIVLIVCLWVIATEFLGIQKIFLPSVKDTLKKLIELSQTTGFWLDVSYSFLRVLLGFMLSVIVSYPLMVFSLYNKKIKEVIFYIVEFFRYLPIPVFIPLTILWFGVGDYGKIMIVFLGTFAQMIPMYYDSALAMDGKFDAFTFGLKWNRFKYITKIIIPGSLPTILDNSRLCFGWAWTYLIIAELLGAENGIGYAIIRAQRYLASDTIFAYIIAIGIIGVVTDRVLLFTKIKTFTWL